MEAELERVLALPPELRTAAVDAVRRVCGEGCARGLERRERLGLDLEGLLGEGRGRGMMGQEGEVEEVAGGGKHQDSLSRLDLSQTPKLKTFMTRIHGYTWTRPHLLLAYMWVLYLALFSGGRYIRARLRRARFGQPTSRLLPFSASISPFAPSDQISSWQEEKQALSLDADVDMDAGLSFWTFAGEEDGEDLKIAFKKQLLEAEDMLSESEKEEVVQEAIFIMHAMGEIVGEIRDVLGGEQVMLGKKGELDMTWLMLKHVLPMGLPELVTGVARGVGSLIGAAER